MLNSLFFIVSDSPRLCLSCFDALNLVSVFSLFAFPRLSRFLSLFQLFLSQSMCVCVCPFTVVKPFLSELGAGGWYLGLRGPALGQKEQEDKRLPPTPKPPHHTCLLGSCCDSAKGRERETSREEGGENGTMKEGQEIQRPGSREEESPR